MKKHFDVLIMGAGLSGICIAHYIQKYCPNKRFAILEARANMGGTWDLFKYPGVRSDSDMSTLGYRFRPWTDEQQIADGPSILQYIKDTAKEEKLEEHIQFHRKITKADWSSEKKLWTISVLDTQSGKEKELTCGFFISCSGYYNYEKGYTPRFKNVDQYQGTFIHPQHWPEDLDYKGKKVLVIGSGATAITLVPSMAKNGAGHVTMLQRSPTYIIAAPLKDKTAKKLMKVLPESWAYGLVRKKNIILSMFLYNYCKARPEKMKKFLLKNASQMLPEGYDVEKHFSPSYNPWDQRLCLVPNGDFFKQIKKGNCSVVTDHIDSFTEKGILLKSGEELEADIIVSATGLVILPVGGVQFFKDGTPFDMSKEIAYKGTMLSNLPNFSMILGYTNASWTLKADLTAEYLCKLLNHMDKHQYTSATPRYSGKGKGTQVMSELQSGYINRASHFLPYNGSKKPWKVDQNYFKDVLSFRYGKLEDGHMEFE